MPPSAALRQLPPDRTISVLCALQRIAGTAAHPCETGRVLRALTTAMEGALQASAALATAEVEGRFLRIRAGTGVFAAQEGEMLPVAGSLAGTAFCTGAARATADVQGSVDAFFTERELDAGAYLAAPLVAEGRTVGVALAARAPGAPPFGAADAAALALVVDAVAGGVAGAEAEEARRRERLETSALRTERQLREQAARLDAALGLAEVVGFELDPSTGRTAWTGDVKAMLGFAPEGTGALLDRWIARVHADDIPLLRGALAAGGRARVRMADPAQATRAFDLRAAPQASGAVLCVLRHAEAAAVRGVETVGEMEGVREVPAPRSDPAMLRALARAVRHELDEPLAVVAGEALQLTREWIVQAEPGLERSAAAIHDAAQRLSGLASRLAAVEQDPGALVVTGDGAVSLRPDGADAADGAEEPAIPA